MKASELKPYEMTIYFKERDTGKDRSSTTRHDEIQGAFKTAARVIGKNAYRVTDFEIRQLGVAVFRGAAV